MKTGVRKARLRHDADNANYFQVRDGRNGILEEGGLTDTRLAQDNRR